METHVTDSKKTLSHNPFATWFRSDEGQRVRYTAKHPKPKRKKDARAQNIEKQMA
jgi:hypothetical protein